MCGSDGLCMCVHCLEGVIGASEAEVMSGHELSDMDSGTKFRSSVRAASVFF